MTMFPSVEIDIRGTQGNAFVIMGVVSNVFEQCGGTIHIDDQPMTWPEVQAEMTAGDYENLLDVTERYITIVGRD